MYVYRLSKCPNINLSSISLKTMREYLVRTAPLLIEGYSPLALDADVAEFKRLLPMIGWSGTQASDIRCFAVPNPNLFTPGFLLFNGNNNHVFVGSPAPLAYLNDEALDRTDSDEKARTISGMTGVEWTDGTPVEHGGWRRSAKGNMWTTMDGTHVIVVPEGMMYKGMLRGGQNNILTTRLFRSEDEAMNYLERSYRKLIQPWKSGATSGTDPDGFVLEDSDD